MWRLLSALLAAGLCLMFVQALQAQDHVCISYGADRYLSVTPNRLMIGTLAIFDDANCTSQTDTVEASSRGWAYASTQARAAVDLRLRRRAAKQISLALH